MGELCWTGCVATCDSCSSTIAQYFIAFHCSSMFMWRCTANCTAITLNGGNFLQHLWNPTLRLVNDQWLFNQLTATLECACKIKAECASQSFLHTKKHQTVTYYISGWSQLKWLCLLYSGQCIVVLIRLHECRLHLWKSANRSVRPSRPCTLTSQAKAQNSTGNVHVVRWQCNAKGKF